MAMVSAIKVQTQSIALTMEYILPDDEDDITVLLWTRIFFRFHGKDFVVRYKKKVNLQNK
jgi:hypothetical protein